MAGSLIGPSPFVRLVLRIPCLSENSTEMIALLKKRSLLRSAARQNLRGFSIESLPEFLANVLAISISISVVETIRGSGAAQRTN
jgi:hypothetical protein